MINYTPVPDLSFWGMHLATHGLLMGLAFIIGYFFSLRAGKKNNLSIAIIENGLIVGVIAGLFGSRLVYLATFGMTGGFWAAIKIWEGGMSSHGGYIFGIAAAFVYFKIKRADVWRYADVLMPSLLIAWAVGRIGCFLNWDSFGKITAVPWAVVVFGEARHPTQLYESLGYFLAFIAIWLFFGRLSWWKTSGRLAALSLGAFSLIRFIVNFFRDDPFSYLVFSQTIGGLIIAAAVVFIIRGKECPNYDIMK
jgi:phosphatidylglycerol:prolipoprotein diacylglycerol transferase